MYMYGENTKYHGNPYIQGTTVPCDTCSLYSVIKYSTCTCTCTCTLMFVHYTLFSSYFFLQLRTPLHKASAAGQTAVVTLLLDHGADRNDKDKVGCKYK